MSIFILFMPPKEGETVPKPVGMYYHLEGAEKWISENVGVPTAKITLKKIEPEQEWVTLRNTMQTWQLEVAGDLFQVALVNPES